MAITPFQRILEIPVDLGFKRPLHSPQYIRPNYSRNESLSHSNRTIRVIFHNKEPHVVEVPSENTDRQFDVSTVGDV